jgi:hypothetical protein
MNSSIVGSRFGGQTATVWGGSMSPNQVAAASTVVAPATTVYGPAGAQVSPAAGARSGPGHWATWMSVAGLVALLAIRHTLPK